MTVAIAFVVACCVVFYRCGYSDGKRDGRQAAYEAGRIDAERWWERAELEVQQEREKIWRQE